MRAAPSRLTDHGRLRCLLVLKVRQPARTATSAPQGGHTSRCGPSLAQARRVHTLSSLHLTNTCLACAHLALVYPMQLGPHMARLKERTDEHSGKRACLDLASGDWMPDTEVRRHGQACVALTSQITACTRACAGLHTAPQLVPHAHAALQACPAIAQSRLPPTWPAACCSELGACAGMQERRCKSFSTHKIGDCMHAWPRACSRPAPCSWLLPGLLQACAL